MIAGSPETVRIEDYHYLSKQVTGIPVKLQCSHWKKNWVAICTKMEMDKEYERMKSKHKKKMDIPFCMPFHMHSVGIRE